MRVRNTGTGRRTADLDDTGSACGGSPSRGVEGGTAWCARVPEVPYRRVCG
ncbi:hypothetical protein [Streptomyces sp. NPDC058307]|uniref:hypothetical protein n=1 Tax=Streptomyces sp. NPDC058307 TaxID=3346439 RepID=UPI0036E28CE9